LQLIRELQVRLKQLDKEGAELREENAVLHMQLASVEEARGKTSAAEVPQISQRAADKVNSLSLSLSVFYIITTSCDWFWGNIDAS
jgi:hypothetical protein